MIVPAKGGLLGLVGEAVALRPVVRYAALLVAVVVV